MGPSTWGWEVPMNLMATSNSLPLQASFFKLKQPALPPWLREPPSLSVEPLK